ncbi:MAG: DUF1287 domain-containing protein [Clostridia bacterium]|nr:DUF1287 domain-containing protein [Clostridia bacterium]
MKKKVLIFLLIIAIPILFLADYYNLLPEKVYYASDFGIETILSDTDYNENGTDDYTDIMLGAREDAKNHPKYDGAYVDGGYPPDDIGVCTDVVWRAFKNAGYSLKDMIDKDIELNTDDYPRVDKPDNNIDFRRVPNLRVFFEKYATVLTNDTAEIEEWQPGDIVIFGDNKHIGIVSDKRNKEGKPYIIHNGGQPNREEDFLKRGEPTGHYRFDVTKISNDVIVAWNK